MVFQPVTGKAGETVPVMAVTILEPSFVAEGPDNPRYGFHHQESATTSRQISFAADAPAQTLAAAGTDYNVVDLPQDILDTLAAWGATDSLDTTATLSLGVEDGNYIQADGKTATITVQLYGGPEAEFNITLFINHQPVQLNGADYLSVRTVKNQMVEATFQIDTSALGALNTVYAIAVTPEDGELESTIQLRQHLYFWSTGRFDEHEKNQYFACACTQSFSAFRLRRQRTGGKHRKSVQRSLSERPTGS